MATSVRKHGRSRAALLANLATRSAALIGALILGLVVFGAAFAPWISPADPTYQDLSHRALPPVGFAGGLARFPLGTDPLGRDMLSRLIFGARISLVVGFLSVLLQALVGVGAGLAAGYFGGWTDVVLMRLVDIQLGIPFLVLAIAVAVVLGGTLFNIVLVLTLTGWVFYARVMRSEVLSLRERDFILAARACGSPPGRILIKHLLPNVVGSVLVLASFQIARMIIAESSLSFLGVGIPPPTPSWGGMVADGRNYLATAWWIATLPGLAILLTSSAANLVGDWLRDALDPTMTDAQAR